MALCYFLLEDQFKDRKTENHVLTCNSINAHVFREKHLIMRHSA